MPTLNFVDALSFNIFNESAAMPYFCCRLTVVILYPFNGFLAPPNKPNIVKFFLTEKKETERDEMCAFLCVPMQQINSSHFPDTAFGQCGVVYMS